MFTVSRSVQVDFDDSASLWPMMRFSPPGQKLLFLSPHDPDVVYYPVLHHPCLIEFPQTWGGSIQCYWLSDQPTRLRMYRIDLSEDPAGVSYTEMPDDIAASDPMYNAPSGMGVGLFQEDDRIWIAYCARPEGEAYRIRIRSLRIDENGADEWENVLTESPFNVVPERLMLFRHNGHFLVLTQVPFSLGGMEVICARYNGQTQQWDSLTIPDNVSAGKERTTNLKPWSSTLNAAVLDAENARLHIFYSTYIYAPYVSYYEPPPGEAHTVLDLQSMEYPLSDRSVGEANRIFITTSTNYAANRAPFQPARGQGDACLSGSTLVRLHGKMVSLYEEDYSIDPMINYLPWVAEMDMSAEEPAWEEKEPWLAPEINYTVQQMYRSVAHGRFFSVTGNACLVPMPDGWIWAVWLSGACSSLAASTRSPEGVWSPPWMLMASHAAQQAVSGGIYVDISAIAAGENRVLMRMLELPVRTFKTQYASGAAALFERTFRLLVLERTPQG